MNEFVTSIKSPSWWIGVFLVGVVTSVIAAYAKPRTDALLSKLSRSWAVRTQARKVAFERKVNAALKSEVERATLRFETVRRLLVGLHFCVMGFAMIFGFGILGAVRGSAGHFWLGMVLGFVATVFGGTQFSADDSAQVLSEVEKRLRACREEAQ